MQRSVIVLCLSVLVVVRARGQEIVFYEENCVYSDACAVLDKNRLQTGYFAGIESTTH